MKLAMEEVGTGARTAAFVHGASAAGDIWREFAHCLDVTYGFAGLLVDLRGHGASPRASSYRVPDFANDLVDTLPPELDLVVGQSLGALSAMRSAAALRPRRLILLDPPLEASRWMRFLLGRIAPLQPRLPDRLIRMAIPDGAPADTLRLTRARWACWDSAMMRELASSALPEPHQAIPPAVPTVIVSADPSHFISPSLAGQLRTAGWDVRVKTGAVHDMHVQDPTGLAQLLDDVLRPQD